MSTPSHGKTLPLLAAVGAACGHCYRLPSGSPKLQKCSGCRLVSYCNSCKPLSILLCLKFNCIYQLANTITGLRTSSFAASLVLSKSFFGWRFWPARYMRLPRKNSSHTSIRDLRIINRTWVDLFRLMNLHSCSTNQLVYPGECFVSYNYWTSLKS